jgi:signal transduction histidine kinase
MTHGRDLESPDDTVEPLFAHNSHLWLSVWTATEAAAILIALYVSFDSGSKVGSVVAMAAILAAYHAAGLKWHDWIIRRTWRVLVFVPVGWALVALAMTLNAGFGLLILSSILQGFVFLPFAWAIGALAFVTAVMTALVAAHAQWSSPGIALTRVGWIPATGVMIGTVLLYIHRANREAVLRSRLIRELDGAQQDLADRAREAGAHEERQRFARDIHDTLAQGFTSVIKHLETIELSLGRSDTVKEISINRIRPHLANAQAVSRSSLADIRHLVWALRPVELNDAPLAAALARIVAQWSEANSVAATFSADLLPPLQPDADVTFLRATQESLSNVARHANARNVSVLLTVVDGLALLTVEDDGVGYAHLDSVSTEKMGLSGMRERVRKFGGHLLIESEAGTGTSLTVAMPLSAISLTPPLREDHA